MSMKNLMKKQENKTKQREKNFYIKTTFDDFIDYDWIVKQDFKCYICNEHFDIDCIDSKVLTNMTVDRLDNTMYHSKSNCKLCCLHCNVSRK